ncbi:MAG: hypothetical protein HY763_03025 [Planctomycetes bacterium]|nr:hypothetical protein [Planctomycetota bacterium]
MDPFARPGPAPETRQLERFCGDWTSDWAIVSPSRETIARFMPKGSKPIPASFAGGHTGELALDGRFLRRSGWYEMIGDQKINFTEWTTWDAKAKRFRTWLFTDAGERHEGWMKPSADGRSFRMGFTAHDRFGGTHSGRAKVVCPDDDTVEWTFSAHGMRLKGTDKRKK